jgi:hypothetical protein
MPPHRRGGGDRQGVKKGAWLPEEDEESISVRADS